MLKNKKTSKIWVISIAASLVVLVGAISSWYVFVKKSTEGNFINLDSWSSFWGGIIGSALTILGAYWVLRLQLDYEEDKRTDEEKTKLKEFENNEIARKKDNVDNTFFNLLNMHMHLLDELKNKRLNGNLQQNLFLPLFSGEIVWEVEESKKNNDYDLEENFNKLFRDNINEIGAFLRLFYRIIKYINEEANDNDIQKNYIGFLRATLSEDLFAVIFYNAFYTNYGEKMAAILLKFNFFGESNEIYIENGKCVTPFLSDDFLSAQTLNRLKKPTSS